MGDYVGGITPRAKNQNNFPSGASRHMGDDSRVVFSERELTFTFAICYRPSVCLSSVCLSSVTFVRPTQAVEIFGNISTALGTLAIH